MNTQRLIATLFVTAVFSGVAAVAASADSVAYIKNGDVWLTTRDASRELSVSTRPRASVPSRPRPWRPR